MDAITATLSSSPRDEEQVRNQPGFGCVIAHSAKPVNDEQVRNQPGFGCVIARSAPVNDEQTGRT
ncbi:hypothetical protein EHS25_001552 [Saitozyma podzolica]|uniref:Uncharacterized protein n=1 Tax=Saitozyma podzolica TaxID=1890683 RepID=A0A427YGJ9_9TREE|nr:hypothetical protein EHS25_001552 [Saitozyma podzolica]